MKAQINYEVLNCFFFKPLILGVLTLYSVKAGSDLCGLFSAQSLGKGLIIVINKIVGELGSISTPAILGDP